MAVLDMIVALLCIYVLNSKSGVSADEHCFTFKGDSYLVFTPGDPYDNSNSAHFELEFRTRSLNGVIMYARGDSSNNDTEALYVRGGHLHYHLFNSGQGGVGRQFGGHFVSNERVDNNAWIRVHVYRSKEIVSPTRHSRNSEWKTGIEFDLNGVLRSYVDGVQRRNVEISNSIYFGGYRHRLSDSVGNFTGEIRGIREHANGYTFDYPSLNYKSLVDLHCFEFQPQ